MKVNVYVTLKPGVLDPQGKAIHHALEGLGFAGVDDVRAGRFIELEVADDVRPSLLSVDLVLGTVAASPDPRMQPAGFIMMAVGVVGFLLTFRRRRENPNSKPPKWGRV